MISWLCSQKKVMIKMMNKLEYDILAYLNKKKQVKQRNIADDLQISLGRVNTAIKNLIINGYVSKDYMLTDKAKNLREESKPKKAVILAAGMGGRSIPLNKNTNKALFIAHGTTLIEHLIMQLHEVNIYDISIIVGYRKEEFEYLIDEYNVRLCVNMEYATSSTLYSLCKAHSNFENCYILPSDLYFYENPFHEIEYYSWYMMCSNADVDVKVIKNKGKISIAWYQEHKEDMIGLAYVHHEQAKQFSNSLHKCAALESYRNSYWEDVLWKEHESLFYPIFMNDDCYAECNSCEDLIHLDQDSPSLQSEVFDIITNVFQIERNEIKHIHSTKAGMTNNSFLFEIHDEKYIMRIPGDGTQHLINRQQEGDVYEAIKSYNISDEILYFNKDNGYKLTKFIPNSYCCDPKNWEDVEKSMAYLKQFHQLKLQVNHTFDVFEKIAYYETLWNGQPSIYPDYKEVKENIMSLKKYLDQQSIEFVLTHIDAVPDNFLFHKENDTVKINLIDWEYAAMQDPHLDIAMFAIYAMYDRSEVDKLIDIYFDNACSNDTRIKIYCYIASCGLLWSNWCEYKRQLGIEFGEYSLRQYRYAKDYYRIVEKGLKKVGEKNAYS